MSTPQPSNGQVGQAVAVGSVAATSAALIALYMWAETTLLGGITSIIRRMMPGIVGQQAAARQVRQLGRQVAGQLEAHTPQLVDQVIRAATSEGAGTPPTEPPASGSGFDFRMPHGERAAQAIRNDLTSELADVRFRLTRLDDDIYKVLAPQSAIDQVLGHGLTPQAAQAQAWREFTRRGVTGFTDKSGREWSLSSYVEMAVRTATTRAFNDSHMQVIEALGGNLVTVTDDGNPCPMCQPWENRVLAIRPDGAHATVAEATGAGLFHPNCKHHVVMVTAYTKLPPVKEWTPAMQDAYKATQKQRALERRIRQAKQQLEYASTAEGRQLARKDVRAAQAAMRAFLAEHEGLLRRSHREQLNLSFR